MSTTEDELRNEEIGKHIELIIGCAEVAAIKDNSMYSAMDNTLMNRATIVREVLSLLNTELDKARIDAVQLYMDTCEENGVDPSWESIHAFQDGQRAGLADIASLKENI